MILLNNLYLKEVKPQYPNCSHTNKFICFNGTVTKAFKPIILEYSQKYVCQKCNLDFKNEVNYGLEDLMVKPYKCPKKDCDSNKFKIIELDSIFFYNKSLIEIFYFNL
jgi:DNA replicative helicase MCM subunit Mcm2 (Cdc46/Mcm family)